MSMYRGRAVRFLVGVVVATTSALVSSSEDMTTAHQLKIREGDITFKVSRYEDEREKPYRIFFWDHAMTGSSYSFNGSGNLVHFKAGSEVYSEVSVSPAGDVEFYRKARLRGRNKKDDDGDHLTDYFWEDFSCHQCLSADHNLCGPEWGDEFGGLAEFCNAVNLSDLGREGAYSVEILCDHHVNTCEKLAIKCDLKCDAGGDAAPLEDYECIPEFFGDGDCDSTNNNAWCGFDSGDCCSCTCMSTSDYHCNHFACIDPEADCMDDNENTANMSRELFESCEYVGGIGNGYCDMENNNEQCGYDGGDCCPCTCVVAPENGWGGDEYSWLCSADGSGFACIDPTAPCVDDDLITAEMVENCGFIKGYGNGKCDLENNNALCGYDGGDCCSCTCVAPENSDDEHRCSPHASGFTCIDPEAACVGGDVDLSIDNHTNDISMGIHGDFPFDMVEGGCGFALGVGNGLCDDENNNELCDYDGGDCCSCTCDPGDNDDGYHCNGFDCIDPSAPCVDDDDDDEIISAHVVAYPRGLD